MTLAALGIISDVIFGGGGRSFGRGGRVRVYGCSPGCLAMSLGLSIVLTIVVNVLIRAFQ